MCPNNQCVRRGNTAIEDAKREKRDSVVNLLGTKHVSFERFYSAVNQNDRGVDFKVKVKVKF
jgi:hypothetical protein